MRQRAASLHQRLHLRRFTVNFAPFRTVEAVLEHHVEHRLRYRPANLTAAWTAVARLATTLPVEQQKLRCEPVSLWLLERHTISAAVEFEPRHVAMTAHRLAQLHDLPDNTLWQPDAVLWRALERRALWLVGSFSPHELSTAASALVKANRPAPLLLDAFAVAAGQRAAAFSSAELAGTALAIAESRRPAPRMFEAVATEATRRLGELEPADLARLAQAFATATTTHGAAARDAAQGTARDARQDATEDAAAALLDAIGAEAARRRSLASFKPAELSALACAYATAGRRAPALLDAIGATAAKRTAAEFRPAALADLAWAYATAGHAAPALFEAIAAAALRAERLAAFRPAELSRLAWAFATAEAPPPAARAELLDACARVLAERADELTPDELAATARAFVAAGHPAPAALVDAMAVPAAHHVADALTPELLAALRTCSDGGGGGGDGGDGAKRPRTRRARSRRKHRS